MNLEEEEIEKELEQEEKVEGEEEGDEGEEGPKANETLQWCDNSSSFICCFSKDTLITVKENTKILKKPISDIKVGDFILTLQNGEKKYTEVILTKKYDDEYKFYEFKCVSGSKTKSISVTHNHIMITYDKNLANLQYKTAENVIKNKDYFNTLDGPYEVKDIKVFNMKQKYALGVNEGFIIADDILVSCLNVNDMNKNLSLDDLIKKYNVQIL